MPFSFDDFNEFYKETIQFIQPKTILDVGPGAGKHGILTKNTLPSSIIDCVEPTSSYLEQYKLNDLYNSIYQTDIKTYINENPRKTYDMVIFSDILEHMFRSEVFDVLDFFSYRSEWIFVAWPINLRQDDWEGNKYEVHKSNFTISEISNLFEVVYYRKYDKGKYFNIPEHRTIFSYNACLLKGYYTQKMYQW